jgi:hypothetical protein
MSLEIASHSRQPSIMGNLSMVTGNTKAIECLPSETNDQEIIIELRESDLEELSGGFVMTGQYRNAEE